MEIYNLTPQEDKDLKDLVNRICKERVNSLHPALLRINGSTEKLEDISNLVYEASIIHISAEKSEEPWKPLSMIMERIPEYISRAFESAESLRLEIDEYKSYFISKIVDKLRDKIGRELSENEMEGPLDRIWLEMVPVIAKMHKELNIPIKEVIDQVIVQVEVAKIDNFNNNTYMTPTGENEKVAPTIKNEIDQINMN